MTSCFWRCWNLIVRGTSQPMNQNKSFFSYLDFVRYFGRAMRDNLLIQVDNYAALSWPWISEFDIKQERAVSPAVPFFMRGRQQCLCTQWEGMFPGVSPPPNNTLWKEWGTFHGYLHDFYIPMTTFPKATELLYLAFSTISWRWSRSLILWMRNPGLIEAKWLVQVHSSRIHIRFL